MNSQQFDKEVQESGFEIKKLCREGLLFSSYNFDLEKTVTSDVLQIYSPDELYEKAREAEKKFDEIISDAMEQNRLPQYLSNLMQDWKTEAEIVFKQYDDIIAELNHDVDTQDMDYRIRIENYCNQHEEIRNKTENLILELNKTGRDEVSATRNSIINHSKRISDELWNKNGSSLDETSADKPFDTYLWKTPTEMLALEQLEDVFLIEQKDTTNLRIEFLSKICKMRSKLEVDKMNYNLDRQILEQEIFDMKQNCNSSVPAIAKMKRKCFRMLDKKERLVTELKSLNDLIKKEQKLKEKMANKNNVILQKDYEVKHLEKRRKICDVTKHEMRKLFFDISKQERFLFENVLQISMKTNTLFDQKKFNASTEVDFEECMSEKYWKQILDEIRNALDLEKFHNALLSYWEELQCCNELLVQNQESSTLLGELKVLMENYLIVRKS